MQEDLNAASATKDLVPACKCHDLGSVLLSDHVTGGWGYMRVDWCLILCSFLPNAFFVFVFVVV